MAKVAFNRHFTQAQLTAAVGTASINGTAVIDGTWYVAASGATAVYVGSTEGRSTAILKLVGQVNGNTLSGKDITDLINDYLTSGASPLTKILSVESADKATNDVNGNQIDSTYLKKSGGKMTGGIVMTDDTYITSDVAVSGGSPVNLIGHYTGGDDCVEVGDESVPTVIKSSDPVQREDGTHSYTMLDSSAQSLSAAEKTQIRSNIDAASPADVDSAISDAISDLGSIMHFEGTVATETALKALTNVKKGDVYVVTADHGEWVATDDIGSTADATKWEKFGTTDVTGALYKGTNTFTNDYALVADGTDGKTKAVNMTVSAPTASSNGATDGAYVESVTQGSNGKISVTRKKLHFKAVQSAVTDPTASGDASQFIATISQNTAGVISVTKKNVSIAVGGSGSVGSSSSAADAWKTVVHDASLAGGTNAVSLSGNTKTIPAATASNDGYMTSTQANNLSVAVGCLTWED